MKDSGVEWIGEIPEGWEVITFSQGIKQITTGLNPRENFKLSNIDDFYYVTIQNFKDGRLFLDEKCDRISKDAWDIVQKRSDLKVNDILFASISKEGQAYLIDKPVTNWNINESVFSIRVNQQYFIPKFFYYQCIDPMFYASLRVDATGTTFQSIKQNKLKKSKLTLPPKETQEKIATYLDEKCSQIEQTIQNQQQVIEKLKAYKQSLITEAVTGKVKIQNGKVAGKYEQYKDSGVEWIGEIPSGWEVKKLKYIADSFLKGSGITKDEIVINGDTPCVRYGELYTKYDYHFSKCETRTNLEIIETPKYFSHGDVLFTCTGELVEEIGKSIAYLGNEKCLAGGDIIVLKHSQDPMFMGYALDSKYVQGQKSFGKTKLKVVHISSGEIAGLLIALPSKEEQKSIAEYLDKTCAAIDFAIEQKQKLIEKLTEYKKSLIYECVTGKEEI